MDQPIRWTLPAPAFVAFDAPLSVATVDGGLDPAYRTFLREEVGFDADADADAGTLAAAAGRLASKELPPADWRRRSGSRRGGIATTGRATPWRSGT